MAAPSLETRTKTERQKIKALKNNYPDFFGEARLLTVMEW